MDFDAAAAVWDDDPARRERAATVARAIRRFLPAAGRAGQAVELGCGTGLLSFALADAFSRVTLVDSSQGMIEAVTRKIAAAGLAHFFPLRVDLADFPPADFACDAFFSLMALHHFPDHLGLLSRCFRALREPGLLFIADLEKEDGGFHSHIPDFKGHHGFDAGKLKRDLEHIGFTGIEYDRVLTLKRDHGEGEKEFGVFLLKAEKGNHR